MAISNLESALLRVESYLDQVSKALVDNQPDAMVLASADLQCAAVEFSKALRQNNGVGGKLFKSRISKIVGLMASRREILMRRAMMTELALAALVPSSAKTSTYSPSAGIHARQPYSQIGRQSGEFSFLSA